MARCPTCQRRLASGTVCPRDGALVPEAVSESAAPAAPPSAPGFAIRRLLGSGGMAAVWEASTDTGTYVALKVSHSSDPGAAQRLKREADVMEKVGPPYVPAFHGNGMLPDGRPYLAMERLVGRTLGD